MTARSGWPTGSIDRARSGSRERRGAALALAGHRSARPGQHRGAHPGARGRGRAARLDAPVRRPLAADDDRLGGPQRAARLAGPGRVLQPGTQDGACGRRAAGDPAGLAGGDGPVRRRLARGAGRHHERRQRRDARRAAGLPDPHPHLPLPAGVAAAGRDRARPAARRDAAGADRRHDHVPRRVPGRPIAYPRSPASR